MKIKMSSSSSSAETVANIEGLLKQILISIPALSLLRFKLVSKHWLSLISDPDFRRRHSLRNPNPKVSAFFSSKIDHHSFNSIPLQTPPSNPFKDSNLTVLQSCNGLFLLAAGDETNRHLLPIHVVNPTTDELHTLSAPSLENLLSVMVSRQESIANIMREYMFVRYALVFDPRVSPHYSVVCVSHNEIYDNRHRIEIYSSETGAWGSSSLEAPFFLRPYDAGWRKPLHFNDESREGAVYCNGAVHWIRKEAGLPYRRQRIGEVETEGFERSDWDVVHYFNIVEGSLRIATAAPPVTLVMKELYKESSKEAKAHMFLLCREQRYFGESGGRLCLIEVFDHCPTRVEVMEMERDYSSWCVKYIVDLGPVVAPLPGQDASAFVVLFMEKDDEGSTPDLWLHMPGKVVFYDLSTMSVRTSVELDSEEHFLGLDGDKYGSGRFPYMETLACV